jgi:RimJ/RimL family protein N-acetyltransferase
MTPALGPVVLEGQVVRLEPLRPEHCAALLQVAQDDRIWAWLPQRLDSEPALRAFIEQGMAEEPKGKGYTFAVILRDSGRAVGCTKYSSPEAHDRGVEIGWTWYAPEVWGTQVNPEAKYLLMQHAFEQWGAIRVFFKTDERNARSRAAIAKLGAQFEGILRNHRIRPDGSYRNSVYFSVIDSEWPAVKAGLLARLSGVAQRS